MVDSKTAELINREIDGVLSPKESERLKASLADNPEAQEYHDELIDLAQMLEGVKEVDPGPNLKKNILNAIPVQKYQNSVASEPIFSFKGWRSMTRYRFSFAFALGLIIGFFTYSFFSDLPLNNADTTGTLLLNNSSSKFTPADQSELSLGEISGTVSTQFAENIVLFRIDLTSNSEVEVLVEFDADDLRFAGFQPQKYSGGQINVSSNMLTFVTKGRHDYVLVFEDKTSTASQFTVKMIADKVLYKETLNTQKQPKR